MPLRRLAAAFALLLALVVNGLANRLPLGGRTTGELSDLYANLFVPAGVTFSIWGIIYLLLIAWAGVQFLSSATELGRRLALLFALSSVLNATWLLVWHYQLPVVSVLVMGALLVTLVGLNDRIHRFESRNAAGPSGRQAGRVIGFLTLARAAFGVYLGWILVATVVNVTAALVALGWAGDVGGLALSEAFWATVLVVVGAGIGIVTLIRFRNPWIGLAVIWALGGIALGRWEAHPAIAWTAICMMVAVGSATITQWWTRGPGSGQASAKAGGSA
ncbi:MAG: hypothetical protein EA351_06400 [Gemmatimonadales bacterium]|nr:MAG: hypothetical protein EA351_06400 [Gemmatimonadales bacterium]